MRVRHHGDWRVEVCPDPGCSAGALRVRRDPRRPDSWWVGRLDGAPWHEAAGAPFCPWCGALLPAAVSAGTGDVGDDRAA